MRRGFAADTRGVSEVIGFVLVFSLVLGTISVVYVGGLSGLDDTRDAERVNNAERAFDVLANNFQQMGRGEAPNRATEIKLADAQLSTSESRRVQVNSSSYGAAVGASTVSIRYDAPGDTNLVYENGAVIRVDDGSAVMRREPDFLFSDGTVVVRFIKLKGSEQGVGGSSSTALVRAETQQSNVLVNRGTSDKVNVTIHTHPDRAEVWSDYLGRELDEATGNSDCTTTSTASPNTVAVTCRGDSVDKLAVSRMTIDVTLT